MGMTSGPPRGEHDCAQYPVGATLQMLAVYPGVEAIAAPQRPRRATASMQTIGARRAEARPVGAIASESGCGYVARACQAESFATFRWWFVSVPAQAISSVVVEPSPL